MKSLRLLLLLLECLKQGFFNLNHPVYDINWRKQEYFDKKFPEFSEPIGPTDEINYLKTITPLSVSFYFYD